MLIQRLDRPTFELACRLLVQGIMVKMSVRQCFLHENHLPRHGSGVSLGMISSSCVIVLRLPMKVMLTRSAAADRNLGQNGIDLDSPSVQAFYAGPRARVPQHSPRAGYTFSILRPLTPERSRVQRPVYLGSSVRSRSLSSSRFPLLTQTHAPRQQSSPLLRQASSVIDFGAEDMPSNRPGRRMSLSAFAPGSLSQSSSSWSNNALHILPANISTEPPSHLSRRPDSAIRQTIFSLPEPNTLPSETPQSTRYPRDSLILAKERGTSPLASQFSDDVFTKSDDEDEPTVSNIPTSHRISGVSSIYTPPSKTSATRHSAQTFRSSVSSFRYPSMDFHPLTHPRPRTSDGRSDIFGGSEDSGIEGPGEWDGEGPCKCNTVETQYGVFSS